MQAGGLLPQSNKKAGPVDGNKDYGTLQRNTFGKYITSQTKAKNGMKMTKAKSGKTLKEPTDSQKGLKKLPTAVRNKMGYAKKGAKMMGGKCKNGC